MMGQAVLTATIESGIAVVTLHITDPDQVGKPAWIELIQQALVKGHARPLHGEHPLGKQMVMLASGSNRIEFNASVGDFFAYGGNKLELRTLARVKIDDGFIRDTELECVVPSVELTQRQRIVADAASIHSPADVWNFRENLKALSLRGRAIVLGLLLIGAPFVAINTVVGVHDQLRPEADAFFYDKNGANDDESPFMKALAGSGGVGLTIWLLIMVQMRKYTTFKATLRDDVQLTRDGELRLSEIIDAVPRVALENATLRVVAYNLERGQYEEKSNSKNGSHTRICNFSDPAGGVALYERAFTSIPAKTPLAIQLGSDNVVLAPIFDALYPPISVGEHHGLGLQLEVQLLHPKFKDQEAVLAIKPERVCKEDFGGVSRPSA